MLSDGSITVVTGGASGIGHATTEYLVSQGRRVVVLDVAGPRERVPNVEYLTADVGDVDQVTTAMRRAGDLGPVLGLVNAAGIRGGDETVATLARDSERLGLDRERRRATSISPLELVSGPAFERMLRIHLLGSFHTMQACLPGMLAARYGSIVNVSSICGIEGCATNPHYAAAKAAIIGLTKSIATDAGRSNVRVNIVAPGYVRTPMMGAMEPRREDWLLDQIPMGRFAEPIEIAGVIEFLLSDRAAYVCGQVISPNGGQVV